MTGRQEQAGVDPGGVGVLGLQQEQDRRRRAGVEVLQRHPERERRPVDVGGPPALAQRPPAPGDLGVGRVLAPLLLRAAEATGLGDDVVSGTSGWSSAPNVAPCTTGDVRDVEEGVGHRPGRPGERNGGSQPATKRRSAGLRQVQRRRRAARPGPARRRRTARGRRRPAGRAHETAGGAAQRPGPAEQPDLQPAARHAARAERATGCQACSSEGSRLPNTGPAAPVGRAPARRTVRGRRAAAGRACAVRSGASQTQPCRSSTAQGIGQVGAGRRVPAWPRGTGCPRSGPSASNRHPWYRALQAAVDDGAGGQRHEPVRAAGGEGGRPRRRVAAGRRRRPGRGAHRHRRRPHLGGAGHREPAGAEGSPRDGHVPLHRPPVPRALRRPVTLGKRRACRGPGRVPVSPGRTGG